MTAHALGRALNSTLTGQRLDGEALMQNHKLCTNAATSIGCGVRGLTHQQLSDAPANKQPVLQLLWNLVCPLSLVPFGVPLAQI